MRREKEGEREQRRREDRLGAMRCDACPLMNRMDGVMERREMNGSENEDTGWCLSGLSMAQDSDSNKTNFQGCKEVGRLYWIVGRRWKDLGMGGK